MSLLSGSKSLLFYDRQLRASQRASWRSEVSPLACSGRIKGQDKVGID